MNQPMFNVEVKPFCKINTKLKLLQGKTFFGRLTFLAEFFQTEAKLTDCFVQSDSSKYSFQIRDKICPGYIITVFPVIKKVQFLLSDWTKRYHAPSPYLNNKMAVKFGKPYFLSKLSSILYSQATLLLTTLINCNHLCLYQTQVSQTQVVCAKCSNCHYPGNQ